MDIGRIFSRSFELMWRYKFLWLFALVMGLTDAGSGGSSNLNSRMGDSSNPFRGQTVEPVVIALAVLVGLILLAAWLVLVFYLRFVSRGALVATVRDVEAQQSVSLQTAWHSGRTFYARLLGLGLVVNLPLILVLLVILAVAFLPLFGTLMAQGNLNGLRGQDFAGPFVGSILAICCALLCVVLLTLVIHPLYEFAVRAIVIQDLRTLDGIRHGLQRARENLGSVLVVYLILMGARIVYGILVAIVAIPLGLVLVLGLWGMMQSNLNLFIIVLLVALVPVWLLFGALEGVFALFESNVWTETYLAVENKAAAASA